MTLQKNIISKVFSPKFIILAFFIVLHVFLFNVNIAEWGDSYRILIAAEELRSGIYPEDEKRPPLLSAVLSVRPLSVNPVLWGRVTMLFLSVFSFLVFYELLSLFIKEERYRTVGMLLFSLNPVYLYWSLRIMADVPFSLLAVLLFYLYTQWRGNLKYWQCFLLGSVGALSVLMRFEGYLLVFSLGIALLFDSAFRKLSSFSQTSGGGSWPLSVLWMFLRNSFTKGFLNALVYGVSALALLAPYLIFRNPLSSSYFSEPSGREYNIKTVLIYGASLLFLFGFTSVAAIFTSSTRKILNLVLQNIGLSVFVCLELFLILLWPAAIPRLFVSIIPLIIIFMVVGIREWFSSSNKVSLLPTTFAVLSIFVYLGAQQYLGLQFLVMTKTKIFIIALLQIPLIYFMFKRRFIPFVVSASLSMLVWSAFVIMAHRNIYISVRHAAEYAASNFTGTFAYNDESTVSRWYLNYVGAANTVGKKYRINDGSKLNPEFLEDNQIDYLLITNEHNLGLDIDFEKRNFLHVLKEFRYNVNGAEFVTYLVEVRKDML
jgi:hypothetical protein